MRYKDYTWPHNPETYTIAWERSLAAQKVPFGSYCLQDLGTICRVMRGEGTFAGENAYDEFRALAEVFAQDGPGLLVHPLWPAASAYFVSLTLTEQPQPDFVRYAFEFWENGAPVSGLTAVAAADSSASATAGTGTAAAAAYTVRKGDTLWGIAKTCGVKLRALIAANPQIKNPNLIYPGDKVKIP